MYFRNAKIFGEFVGAQGVDVGIDPYAQLQGFRESRRGIDPYARTVKSGIIRKKRQHSQSGCCRKSAS